VEPFAMAACGSESSRWADMHHTSAVDPFRKFRLLQTLWLTQIGKNVGRRL